MKNKFTIIGLVGAALLFLSCSTDDLQDENQQVLNDSFNKQENVQYDEEGNPMNTKDKD